MNPIARRALLLAAAAAHLGIFGVRGPAPPQRIRPGRARGPRGQRGLGGLAQRGDPGHRHLGVQHRHPRRVACRRRAGEQDQPAISDRYIVWIDNGRLRAKDLSSGRCSASPPGPRPRRTPPCAARSSSGATRPTTRISTPRTSPEAPRSPSPPRRWRRTRPATPAGSSTRTPPLVGRTSGSTTSAPARPGRLRRALERVASRDLR